MQSQVPVTLQRGRGGEADWDTAAAQVACYGT